MIKKYIKPKELKKDIGKITTDLYNNATKIISPKEENEFSASEAQVGYSFRINDDKYKINKIIPIENGKIYILQTKLLTKKRMQVIPAEPDYNQILKKINLEDENILYSLHPLNDSESAVLYNNNTSDNIETKLEKEQKLLPEAKYKKLLKEGLIFLTELHKKGFVHDNIQPKLIYPKMISGYEFEFDFSRLKKIGSEIEQEISCYQKPSQIASSEDDYYTLAKTICSLNQGIKPESVNENELKDYDLNFLNNMRASDDFKRIMKLFMCEKGFFEKMFGSSKSSSEKAMEELSPLKKYKKYAADLIELGIDISSLF